MKAVKPAYFSYFYGISNHTTVAGFGLLLKADFNRFPEPFLAVNPFKNIINLRYESTALKRQVFGVQFTGLLFGASTETSSGAGSYLRTDTEIRAVGRVKIDPAKRSALNSVKLISVDK